MPRMCPHCGLEITGDSRRCPNCGQPQDAPAGPNPQTESDRRFPLWQILPWTLLAAALLLLLPPLLRQKQPQSLVSVQSAAAPISAMPSTDPPSTSPSTSVNSPAASVNSPAANSAAGQSRVSKTPSPETAKPPADAPVPVSTVPVPLTVTLYSASRNKHVAVGTPVTISAYAVLPPGKSATLAVSYGKDKGPKSLLSLVQGSLSSTTWTPFLPGHYSFTASALDSRKNGAFSRPVLIFVDAPAPMPAAKTADPVRVAVQPAPAEPKVADAPPAAARPRAPKPHVTAAAAKSRSVPKRQAVPAAAKSPYHAAAAKSPYHVAAAVFPLRRIAATLAAALRGRGFHAFVRPGIDASGKPNYRVETGDFPSKPDADAQMRLLEKDGYPAYLFQTR